MTPVEIAQLAREIMSGDRTPQAKARAMTALAEALELLPVGELARLDDAVRTNSTVDPAVADWTWARAREAWGVLGVLTFHRDGYLRQRALQALGAWHGARALPFLLLRLNDWVRELREAARAMLPALLTRDNADAVVAAMPLLSALDGKRRDNHKRTLALFASFLRGPAGIPAARRGTDARDPAVRRACYQLLFDAADVAVAIDGDLLVKALRDPSPLLRLEAFRVAARLRPVPLALLEAARADPFLPVRREAFRLLLDVSPAHAEREIRAALLDRAAGLRWEAVHAHWQRTRQRAVSIYRIAVAAETGSRQVYAVLGLGEHGDRADAALVVPFLSSPRIGLRRAAVRALARLDGEHCSQHFIAALEDASPGVSREAQRALMRSAIPPAAANRLEALVSDATTVANVRRNALDVLGRAGKWRAIAALIRACGDADASFAAIAHDRVHGWLNRYNNSFAQPTTGDIAALTAALAIPAARRRLGPNTSHSLDAIASAFSSAPHA